MYDLTKDAANPIPFVLVDSAGTEVTGLGGAFTVALRKNGGAFGASAGAKAELSSGWYLYTATAGESDTDGPLALKITGAGVVQQNLVYRVSAAAPSAADNATAAAAAILVTPANKLAAGVGGVAVANVTQLDGDPVPLDNLVLALGSGGLVEKLNTTLELDGAVYRFTLNALEQAPDSGLTAGETGDAVLDEVVEGAYTMRQLLRIMLAALAGKSSGGGTSTITFRDVADSKNRISATVGGTGNRTAITLDGS